MPIHAYPLVQINPPHEHTQTKRWFACLRCGSMFSEKHPTEFGGPCEHTVPDDFEVELAVTIPTGLARRLTAGIDCGNVRLVEHGVKQSLRIDEERT